MVGTSNLGSSNGHWNLVLAFIPITDAWLYPCQFLKKTSLPWYSIFPSNPQCFPIMKANYPHLLLGKSSGNQIWHWTKILQFAAGGFPAIKLHLVQGSPSHVWSPEGALWPVNKRLHSYGKSPFLFLWNQWKSSFHVISKNSIFIAM